MTGASSWLRLSAIAAEVGAGERSASELITDALAKASAVGTPEAGFVAVLERRARAHAKLIDQAVSDGVPLGPLAGVPIVVKDNIALAGYRSQVWRQFPGQSTEAATPVQDAPCVHQLEAGGAVVIGTTHMAEWAMGVTGANPHLPTLKHPMDARRVPGGSSSGSAVAVATGVVRLALGTDTGGSVRIPAALCGVTGFRPTAGLIPTAAVLPVSSTFDRVGILARSAADIATALTVFGDHGDKASTGGEGAIPAMSDAGHPRIGIVQDATDLIPEGELARAFGRACEQLGCVGDVEVVRLPGWADAAEACRKIVNAEAAAFHRDRLASSPQQFGTDVRDRLRFGASLTPYELTAAKHALRRWQSDVDTLLSTLDLLIAPTCGTIAPLREDERDPTVLSLLSVHTYAVSACGAPAVSLPCGNASDGMPVGLQLVGRRGDDQSLLRHAEAVQATLHGSGINGIFSN